MQARAQPRTRATAVAVVSNGWLHQRVMRNHVDCDRNVDRTRRVRRWVEHADGANFAYLTNGVSRTARSIMRAYTSANGEPWISASVWDKEADGTR